MQEKTGPLGVGRGALIPDFVGPRELGRLLLLKPIARGGMGEVYLAALGEIEGAERPCVVKLIRKEHREDASFLARFLDEARIQAQMQHPGVAQVLEATLDQDGQPYVVVEHVQGRDLAEIRQRAAQLKLAVSWSDAVAIAASIADALAHVHERTDAEGRPLEVVHRDLSPQNIMVSYAGDTKLIDFGTARGENRRCQTINGIVFAKPGYVAPEVAANNPGGAAADLYALGVVLWELVAGRRFLQGDSREHLAAVARGERTPPPLSLWLAVPRELDTIVGRLTATLIADRYESAREATEQLVKLLQQAPSLPGGERSVRARVAHLMLRLYPAEPARARAEFAELVAAARRTGGARPDWTGAPGNVSVRELLFPGTRYRVVREIARGSMSVVHEAHHVDLGRKVALKVLDRQSGSSQEAASRFRHEARVVAQLRHPNLVQVHDFGVSADGRPYYAMEYLEGETLAERLAKLGRLPWEEAVALGVQACQALEAAHSLGVIHRDIKPANLFLTAEGVLKLLDFGITQTDVEPDHTSSESLRLIGTPEYMAPEQIGQRCVDARADIYALGSVLYELVTGCLPHSGANTVTLLDNKVHDRVKPPSQRTRKLGLPRQLDRVLLSALATAVKDRHESAAALRRDLLWLLGSKERGQQKRRRALATTLTLASAAAIGAALLARHETEALTALHQALAWIDPPAAVAVRAPAPLPAPAVRHRPTARVDARVAAAGPAASAAASAGEAAAPSRAEAAAPRGADESKSPGAVDGAVTHAAPAGTGAAAPTKSAPSPSEAPAAATAEVMAAEVMAAAAATAEAAPTKSAPSPSEAPAGVTAAVAATAEAAGGAVAPAAATASAQVPGSDAVASPATAAPPSTAASAESAPVAAASPESTSQPGAAASRDTAASAPAKAKTPRRVAARSAQKAPRRNAALDRALSEAESLMGHRDLEALEAFRQLARRHPREPRVLRGWSEVAALTRWWGESLRAAERWAAVERTAEAHIHLARTQRRLGQLDKALATLQRVLSRNPRHREAQSLLELYGGTQFAALR